MYYLGWVHRGVRSKATMSENNVTCDYILFFAFDIRYFKSKFIFKHHTFIPAAHLRLALIMSHWVSDNA